MGSITPDPPRALSEDDDRFYTAPSTIPGAGQGLFARVPLRTGDRLRVIGVVVARESVADRCTQYADAYKIRVGDDLLIPVGWGALINHHDEANVEKVVEDGMLYFRAVRAIGQGEEIVFCYSDYARQRLATKETKG